MVLEVATGSHGHLRDGIEKVVIPGKDEMYEQTAVRS